MSSAVAELEAGLQAMLNLKPPGVSGSRIANLTALCTANVQSESVLIQKIFTHFKKTPGTHKLGVLYVVDSVTRKWTEQAKAHGQAITGSAEDGTYAAGVNRVKELLPVFMTDIIQSAPDDQKEKIKKLVDIWEKGQTFPLPMLNQFKEKLNASQRSTTPEGTPPSDLQASLGVAQPAPNTSSILEALANMARQNNNNAPAANPSNPAQANSYPVPNAQSNPAQLGMNPSYTFSPSTQSVNAPTPAAPFATPLPGASSAAPSNPMAAFGGAPSAVPDPALQQQVMILKTLADANVPQDQWGQIIQALTASNAQGAASAGLPPPTQQYPSANPVTNNWSQRQDENRDLSGYNDSMRSPNGRYRRRSRSLSPQRPWNARDSPSSRRRDDPGYGDYGRDSPGRGRADDRGRGRGNDYRQRSPARRGRSPTPPKAEKWVSYDQTIEKGNIKVLSRTLFVGGVTCSEDELRSIFAKFGTVQSCIVNREKRHAFVKMISRHDAVSAKDGMEDNRQDSSLRTRWGVGFGPRDCSDYATGISIIPIDRLTDADRKWMLTAEFGGSGGKPIVSGLVVEEPDIEIGQGVSSKAISRRMQTDKGGNNGPKSGRDRDDDRYGRRDRRDDDRNAQTNTAAAPPAFPGFPYSMPNLVNGMPMFPPGFVFPGQNQQPPPPGHHQ